MVPWSSFLCTHLALCTLMPTEIFSLLAMGVVVTAEGEAPEVRGYGGGGGGNSGGGAW